MEHGYEAVHVIGRDLGVQGDWFEASSRAGGLAAADAWF